MAMTDQEFADSLAARGVELAPSLEFVIGDFCGKDSMVVSTGKCVVRDALQPPEDLPKEGLLLAFRGTLAPPSNDHFVLALLLGQTVRAAAEKVMGEQFGEKSEELLEALADLLATDKYTFESKDVSVSADLATDFLLESPAENVFWLSFELEWDEGKETAWLAWPRVVLERMFDTVVVPVVEPPTPGPQSPQNWELPAQRPPASAASEPVPSTSIRLPANARRLLRTQVPVIVTLAMKEVPASSLFDIGPGTIIEFERGCDQPLILSVNNLPIGMGEAVKIGDHFGLKVTGILPPEERAARVGGKWKFG